MGQLGRYLGIFTIAALTVVAVSGAPGNTPEELEEKQSRPCQLGWGWTGRECAHTPCGLGFYWNGVTCVASSGAPGCAALHYHNGVECVRAGGGGHNCQILFYWDGATCLRDRGRHTCRPFHYWDGWSCVPVPSVE